jgi:flagellar motor switch protein FliN/FliY
MSQLSNTVEPSERLVYIEQAMSAGLKRVLDSAFGSTLFTIRPSDVMPSAEDCVWFTFEFLPERLGSICFGTSRSSAVSLGHRLLEAKRRVSQHEHHALHATAHLLNQLADSLAQAISARLNVRLECRESAASSPPSPSFESFALEFSSSENSSDLLVCAVSPATLSTLEETASSASVTALATGSAAPAAQNLDLLLDLEMPVTISFGGTRLPLNEIAKLTTGSIVELNRTVAEPVEIVVNNRSIARGEVVVVEGNFAVRINQVMSRHDRLRSLS